MSHITAFKTLVGPLTALQISIYVGYMILECNIIYLICNNFEYERLKILIVGFPHFASGLQINF